MNITSRVFDETENDQKTVTCHDEQGNAFYETVTASGEVALSFTDGPYQGRTITAFCWIVCDAAKGDRVNVTEESTGMRLALVQMGNLSAKGPSFSYSPTDAEYNAAMPEIIKACAVAAFDRFRRASKEQLDSMMNTIDQLPKVSDKRTLH